MIELNVRFLLSTVMPIILLMNIHYQLFAQHPQSEFAVNSPGCLNQTIVIENQSTNATDYIWDFCHEDLNHVMEVEESLTISGAVVPTGVAIVKQSGEWFGFISSRDNNKLFRLDFGTNLEATPAIVELGNIDGKLSGPQSLVFFEEDDVIYGLLTNYVDGKLLRLSFSSGLGYPPLIDIVPNIALVQPRGIDLDMDADGNIIVAIAAYGQSKIQLVNFGSSILNDPAPVDITDVGSVGNGPIGVQLMFDQGNWIGYVSAFSENVINKLSFGSNLSSTPVITQLHSIVSPAELSLKKEGGTWHLFATTASGSIHQIKNPNLSPPQIEILNLTNFGQLNNTFGFSITRSAPIWYGFGIDFVSNKLTRIKFSGTCTAFVSLDFSTEVEPTTLTYSEDGLFYIDLTTASSSGTDTSIQTLSIQNLVASSVTISPDNSCLSSNVQFQSHLMGGSPISSWLWDFGNGSTSTDEFPITSFGSIGSFSVSLDITSSNGCANRLYNVIQIFNAPTSSFQLPTDPIICSHHDYVFTNISSFDPQSNPSWEWKVNDVSVSTDEDLTHAFTTSDPQQIKLIATIPGCNSESNQNLTTIEEGPLADFSFEPGCEGESILFSNTTVGEVQMYSWDFDDGNNSTDENPGNTFADFGTYNVTLQTQNAAGCQNLVIKPVQIYSKPAADFSIALPPFSCAGSPSQFNDLTPAPTDSNIESWSWIFGDPQSGSSSSKNPQYTYATAGSYDVTLGVTTNFGCTNSFQKSVTISSSPVAAFTSSAACVNKATQFTDGSSGNISSWQWKVGILNTYTIQNPTHVFSNPANYNVDLTVTASNGCISTSSKMVNVPVPPSLNFMSSNDCAGQATIFTDSSMPSADLPSSWSWNFANQGMGNGATASHTFNATGPFNVTMTVQNTSGCVYALSKNITINPTPVAGFIASTLNGPPPLQVQFANSSTGATTYQWKFNDDENSISSVQSPQFEFSDLGEYLVELTAINGAGCADTFSEFVNVIIPYVDLELVGVSMTKNESTGSTSFTIDIKNNSNFKINGLNVLMELSGGSVISERVNVPIEASATIAYTMANEVVSQGRQSNYICLSLSVENDQNSANNKQCINLDPDVSILNPYPNPAVDSALVEWIAFESGVANIAIYNSTGQVEFLNDPIDYHAGLNRFAVDISKLSAGLHYVRFECSNTQKTFPLVVRR